MRLFTHSEVYSAAAKIRKDLVQIVPAMLYRELEIPKPMRVFDDVSRDGPRGEQKVVLCAPLSFCAFALEESGA